MPANAWFQLLERAHEELGRKAFTPCYEILLYGTADREAFRPAVVAAVDAVRQRFAGAFGWHKTNTMKYAKESASDPAVTAANYLESTLIKPPKLAGIEFHSGRMRGDFGVPSLDFFSTIVPTEPSDQRKSRSYLRVALPLELDDQAEALRRSARAIVQQCPLYAGHAGWSFYWSVVNPSEKEVLRGHARHWLSRFAGLSYGNPLVFLELIGDGLLNVSWLTYVDRSALEQRSRSLEATLAHLRDAGVQAEVLGDRTLEVQAGPVPQLGDRDRNDALPAYRRVGQQLSFLRLHAEQSQYVGVPGMDQEARTAWYNRFFEAD